MNGFENNIAPYGADFASFPYRIKYVVPNNTVGAIVDEETNALQIAAGQDFKFEMHIIDQEGRPYTDDNKSIAKIVFVRG